MEHVHKLWKMKTSSSSGILKTIYFIIVVVYCYLEREIYKTLKFYRNNFSYFKISTSLL